MQGPFGIHNATPPTLGDKEQAQLQLNSDGSLKTAGPGTAGSPSGGVQSVQGASSMYPLAAKSAAPVSIAVAQTVTAGAYSAGQSVGGKITLTGLGNAGAITGIVFRDKAKQAATYELWIFNADPTNATITDNAAFAVHATDLAKVIDIIPIPAPANGGTGGGASVVNGIYRPYKLPAGTTGYAALVTRGTPTFASTSDISLDVIAEVAAL